MPSLKISTWKRPTRTTVSMKAMSFDALPTIGAREIPVATAAQMAEVDRLSSTDFGVSLEALMENACRLVSAATIAFFDGVARKDVVAVAGAGNNGGDALGTLPHLRDAGARVEAFVSAPRDAMRPLAARQRENLERIGVAVSETASIDDRTFVHRFKPADVLIDGLLGYSATGAPRGEVKRMILLTLAGGRPGQIVSVDLPSGLDPDTGRRLVDITGTAVRAAVTVTLGLPKTGLVTEEARAFTGELVVADIGIPPGAFARVGIDTAGLFARGGLLRVAF
jgi:ADP-dependent NAD(P)H-hydrate dehydratase / NAD(P)H-hydrate epimerase